MSFSAQLLSDSYNDLPDSYDVNELHYFTRVS